MRAILLCALLLGFCFAAAAQEGTPIASATHPTNGDQLELFNVQSVCPAGTKRALYLVSQTHPKPEMRGTRIPGCWVHHDGTIYALFDDGDRFRIPIEAFNWRGTKPMKYGSIGYM